jgi:F0F1-type ATP synthase membrane subunit c/vacuolar-type H+-ATPase subunit K
MTERLQGKVAIITGAGSVGAGWGNGPVITSLARAFVRQITPALETEYGIMFGLPSLPEMEAAT